MLTSDIETPRLRLVALGLDTLRALLNCDYPKASRQHGWGLTPEFRDSLGDRFLEVQLEMMGNHPAGRAWGVRSMVRNTDGLVLGHTGFHGPPEVIGRAEVGYHVFVAYRGCGHATEACRALIEWARDRGHGTVFASVSPDNAQSLAVVRRLGFRRSEVLGKSPNNAEDLFEVTTRSVADSTDR